MDTLDKISDAISSFFEKKLDKIESARDSNLSKLNPLLIYSTKIYLITLLIIFGGSSIKGLYEYQLGNYPIYQKVRVGAICYDGWRSYSTGRGTCSHHGGVKEWLYKNRQIDMHYSQHETYFSISLVVFNLIIIPIFFQRYYRFSLLLYLTNVIGVSTYIFFIIISLPIMIILAFLIRMKSVFK